MVFPVMAVIAAAQLAYGVAQRAKAKKEERRLAANKPVYEIPQELLANMTDAQRMALNGMPDEVKKEYIDNIQRVQAASLANLKSRKAGIAGVSGVAQATNDAYKSFGAMNAQAQLMGQDRLMQARSAVAGQQTQAFQWNEQMPYQQGLASTQANQGAATQNMAGAVNLFGQSYFQQQSANALKNYYDPQTMGDKRGLVDMEAMASLPAQQIQSPYQENIRPLPTAPYTYANGGLSYGDDAFFRQQIANSQLSNPQLRYL